jgi:hypothetical protein
MFFSAICAIRLVDIVLDVIRVVYVYDSGGILSIPRDSADSVEATFVV